MKVAPLFGPAVSPRILEQFKCSDRIQFISENDSPSAADVALIFGGDGTVHRYLPQLYAKKIPALVIPKGTGNDFAHALGIHDEKIAGRAWKHFCAFGNNVREIDLGFVRKDDQEIPFCCVVGAGLDADAN